MTEVNGHSYRGQLEALGHLKAERLEIRVAQSQIEQLEEALRSSRIIGAAIGIVMTTREIGYNEALDLLKEQSNRTNVKMRDLCAEMVQSGGTSIPEADCSPLRPEHWSARQHNGS